MTKSTPPAIAARLAARTPVPEDMQQWFALPDGLWHGLIGNPNRAEEVPAIRALAGTSRATGRAGAEVAVAWGWWSVWGVGAAPEGLLGVTAAALRISNRDLAKRDGDPAWVNDVRSLSLQIIEDVIELGITRDARLAAYDLVAWHAHRRRAFCEVGFNALATATGLVDARTGETNPRLLAMLVGHDWQRVADAAVRDGASLHATGQRLPAEDVIEPHRDGTDQGRTLRNMRTSDAYQAIEHDEARRLGEPQRTAEQLARMQVDAFSAMNGDAGARERLKRRT